MELGELADNTKPPERLVKRLEQRQQIKLDGKEVETLVPLILLMAHLNRRMRIGKLDSALLFLSSIVSITFATLQVLLTGMVALIYFLPLFIIGWVLPFYIGYYEGAIKADSPSHRVRGWTYLILGTSIYLAQLGSTITRQLADEITQIIYFSLSNILIFLLSKRLFRAASRIFKICGHQPDAVEEKAVEEAFYAAVFFSIGSYILSLSVAEALSQNFARVLPFGIIGSYMLITGVLFEWRSRRYAGKVGEPYRLIPSKSRPRVRRVAKWLAAAGLVGLWFFCVLSLLMPPNILLQILAIVSSSLSIIGIFFCILVSPQREIQFQTPEDTTESEENNQAAPS